MTWLKDRASFNNGVI